MANLVLSDLYRRRKIAWIHGGKSGDADTILLYYFFANTLTQRYNIKMYVIVTDFDRTLKNTLSHWRMRGALAICGAT